MARFKQSPMHMQHSALTSAFEAADAATPLSKEGNGSYGFSKTGVPLSPAREASVKKAAAVSAKNRAARAAVKQPLGTQKLHQTATTSFGGLALVNKNKKPGLLGM